MKRIGVDRIFLHSRNNILKKCEWFCLITILAALVVSYLRFPRLENDDHSPIIEYIARTGSWPDVLLYRSSMHSLVYHTGAAGLYRFLKWSEPILSIPPVRAGQLINLLGMSAISILLILIFKKLLSDPGARIFAILVFSSSTKWMTAGVTIDNDTLMALAVSLVLFLNITMLRSRNIPSWRMILFSAVLLGISVSFKENGLQYFIPLSGCILVRNRLYGEQFRPLFARVAVIWTVAILALVPIHLRHYRDTGKIIYHDQGFHQKNWSGSRWEFFTFRFGEILRRPYLEYSDITDSRLCRADLSWPSKLYINWWSLPEFLPDRPPPAPTTAIFISALPLTLLFCLGIWFGIRELKTDPGWWVVLGWLGVGIFFLLLASVLFPEPRWACHTYPRHLLGGAGATIAIMGLAFEKLTHRCSGIRYILYFLIAFHLVVFWWLLLSGPFYSFYHPWPEYRM